MMLTEEFLALFVRTGEPWQERPVFLADDDLGPKFHALLEDEELEAVFREFKVSRGLPE